MLIKSHRQESLSRAYIQAIAGRCGMSCGIRDFDYGIDVTVHAIREYGGRYAETGHRIDIQAKSSTTATVTPTEILYDLDVSAYEMLRDPGAGAPRMLVLLLLPEDEATWTDLRGEGLLLRGQAYWMSLLTRPPTKNKKTVRVEVPLTNRFTMEALNHLMGRIRRGEYP